MKQNTYNNDKSTLIPWNLFRVPIAMVFQPNSMFKETFDQGILEAAMTGHIEFWLRNTLNRKKAVVRATK